MHLNCIVLIRFDRNYFSHENHINHGEQPVKRYSLRIDFAHNWTRPQAPKKLQWAYPDIALFLLGKALSACLIFWVAARGKTTLSRYIRVCKETPGIRDLAKTHCGICQGGTDVGLGKITIFGIVMKEFRDAGFPWKRSGNAGSALLFLESAGYVLKKLSAKGQERATEEECLLLNIFRFDW